ncbi:MAG: 30S ribosomal protein S4 [Chloroflexi bacterium]|nr:30S ribosomal protein S4 [Chloroflexota bacterium]
MARYIGATCRLCRRASGKLMLKGERCYTPKCAVERRTRNTAHGRRRRVSDRALQLLEKQKARYTYGLLERQFRGLFSRAEKQAGITGENLQVLLARRLDNVVYSGGFADSRAQARQLILHGHLTLNGKRTDIPSRLVNEGDILRWKESSTRTDYYKQLLESIRGKTVPAWLSLNQETMTARIASLPLPDETMTKFDNKAIVEYYSR